jgi:hypothetical protein
LRTPDCERLAAMRADMEQSLKEMVSFSNSGIVGMTGND